MDPKNVPLFSLYWFTTSQTQSQTNNIVFSSLFYYLYSHWLISVHILSLKKKYLFVRVIYVFKEMLWSNQWPDLTWPNLIVQLFWFANFAFSFLCISTWLISSAVFLPLPSCCCSLFCPFPSDAAAPVCCCFPLLFLMRLFLMFVASHQSICKILLDCSLLLFGWRILFSHFLF